MMLVLGLLIYHFYYIPSSTIDSYQATHKPDVEIVQCPSTENFTQVWNHWSKNFLVENPDAGDEGLIEGWNTLMVNNGCDGEWMNPFENATSS